MSEPEVDELDELLAESDGEPEQINFRAPPEAAEAFRGLADAAGMTVPQWALYTLIGVTLEERDKLRRSYDIAERRAQKRKELLDRQLERLEELHEEKAARAAVSTTKPTKRQRSPST
jgi:hypothetical protein